MNGETSRSGAAAFDIKGKGKAVVDHVEPGLWKTNREDQGWSVTGAWAESRRRAKANKESWDYVLSSGVAGGVAGCVAKTAIAPLDRVKILFQTSNAEFQKFAGTPRGLLNATATIYRSDGVLGLFQGHSATLLRIFPYAGIKYMAYDWSESVLISSPEKRTPGRFFVCGAFSGVSSVLLTYPLELIRVRLAYQTKASEKTSLREAVRTIYKEAYAHQPATSGTASSISSFTRSIPVYPFYRGFSISIVGMVPYAGVSFLTYGTLKRYISDYVPYFAARRTQRDLFCGAIAGAISQTASYPFEVVRRRMQVGGVGGGAGVSWRDAIKVVYNQKGLKGFFVGLSIGYLKVIPMSSISFASWQVMKRLLDI